MATFPMSQCQDGVHRMKDVTALKDAAENLNTRKSTINWVKVFENWCDESGLEKNPETVRPEQLNKVLERFLPLPACVNKTEPTTIVSVICHP